MHHRRVELKWIWRPLVITQCVGELEEKNFYTEREECETQCEHVEGGVLPVGLLLSV